MWMLYPLPTPLGEDALQIKPVVPMFIREAIGVSVLSDQFEFAALVEKLVAVGGARISTGKRHIASHNTVDCDTKAIEP